MARGVATVAALRARCCIDTLTGCWHWQGAMSANRDSPRIWTFDHERGEKRSMSGAKAVWNIAHQEAPRRGWFVFRRCVTADCVNPVHMGQAATKADIGRHIRLSGHRKGTAVESRRANAAKGREARGIVSTPDEIVLAIRAATGTNTAIGLALGVSHCVVSNIRLGKSRAGVVGVHDANVPGHFAAPV